MAGPFNPFGTPFGAPSSHSPTNPFGAPVGLGREPEPAFGAPRNSTTTPASNPFGAPASSPSFSAQASSSNPSLAAHNPFGNPQPVFGGAFPAKQVANGISQSASPFGSPAWSGGVTTSQPTFGTSAADTMSPFGKNAPAPKTGFGGQGQKVDLSSSSPFNLGGRKFPLGQGANSTNGGIKQFQPNQKKSISRPDSQTRISSKPAAQGAPIREPSERTKQLSPFAFNFANKLNEHLRKENIRPPQWLSDLGNPNNRAAVESLKDAYKKYRARAYESLRKADLIDDPDKKRRLADALPFKGICEDMCPEFEQISRIAEHDVKREEKETQPDGLTAWANPSKMLKKFGRSAAGQDAPLPMDVRSVDALRRTVDYLFNDLLQSENNLPSMHNFLWDRTRAVRRDFTFHSQKSPGEMKDLVYCFETITRFHATALHLLSRKGHAQDDFDDKQEIEQLGRTILSLIEAYDACREKNIECENEAEFRAYYLLLNVNDPSIVKRIPTWGKEYWFESEEVQTALSLLQAMEDVRQPRGPIKPRRGMTLSDSAFTNYFAIVEDPKVSYTMACIAEVHFTAVRQNILRNLVKGYARYRDAPRTLSASDLNKMLRFDTPEQAVEFAEAHNFQFSTEYPPGKAPPPAPYMLLNDKKKSVPSPRIAHTFSGQLVERKRGTVSLPHVIYNTIYEEVSEKPKETENSPDSMFVSQSSPPSETVFTTPFQKAEASPASQNPPAVSIFGQPETKAPFFGFSAVRTQAETPKHPTLPSTNQAANASQGAPPGTPTLFSSSTQPAQKASSTAPTSPAVGQFANPAQPLPSILGFGKSATPSAPATKKGQPSPFMTPSPSSSPLQSTTATKSVSFGPSSILGSTPSTSTSLPSPPNPSPKPAQQPTQQPTPLGLSLAQTAAANVPSISVTKLTPIPTFGQGQKPVDSGKPPRLPDPATLGIMKPLPAPPAQYLPAVQATQPILPPSTGSSAPASWQQQNFPSYEEQNPPPAKPPSPKPDLMGGLTNWFVMGDEGLMEQFAEFTVQNIVAQAFQQWEREEAEKKRKAEDDLSWGEARKFRTYSLGVKYFYRWQEHSRTRAMRRILSQGKEKLRAYREQERIAQRQAKEEAEKAERQARRELRKRIETDGQRLSTLASSERRRQSETEEQLLASGIFSGLRDERGAVRRVMKGDSWEAASGADRYAESELDLQPRRLSVSTREPAGSPDSAGSTREGWKTRSLREKFGLEHRRSSSASGSVYSSTKLRQSLPVVKATNFSRKRSATASEEEREAKRKPASKTSGFKTRHWDLRARGFVPMPDGQWLPESIAKQSRVGDSISSLENTGLGFRPELMEGPPSEYGLHSAGDSINDDISSSGLQLRLERLRQARIHSPGGYRSRSGSERYSSLELDDIHGKRKRDEEETMDFEAAGSSPSAPKRAYVSREESHAMVKNVQKMVQELKEAMDVLDEDRVFFREQSGVLGDGS